MKRFYVSWTERHAICVLANSEGGAREAIGREYDNVINSTYVGSEETEIKELNESEFWEYKPFYAWDEEEEMEDKVPCSICHQMVLAKTAHRHQGEWIGDECCWDERLRSSE